MTDQQTTRTTQFFRYVALGDSQSEGVGDGDNHSGLIGLADRLAATMARSNPALQYANLAVRGKLARQVRNEQLDVALELRPDVATVIAGGNDLLRPRFDADEVGEHLAASFAALTAQGAVVATLTFPDVARVIPLARVLGPRTAALNEAIREAAARHSVIVAETGEHEVMIDPRMWSWDRLHATPLGHQRFADALAHALNLPGSDGSWTEPLLAAAPQPGTMATAATELRWTASFLVPWILRRITGRSSGDGRPAKRPQLAQLDTDSRKPLTSTRT